MGAPYSVCTSSHHHHHQFHFRHLATYTHKTHNTHTKRTWNTWTTQIKNKIHRCKIVGLPVKVGDIKYNEDDQRSYNNNNTNNIIIIITLGPLNASAVNFLSEVGRRLTSLSGDPRETSFLFQRLSMLRQRFISALITDSFCFADEDPDSSHQWYLLLACSF